MKTIVALFDDFNDAQRAVDALVEAGFGRADISVVANDASGQYNVTTTPSGEEDAVTAGQGAAFGAVVGGLVGLGALLIPGIGLVVAAGPLVALLGAGIGAAAGAATGGITAALVKTGVSEEHAGYYAEGVRRGGTLVTVSAQEAMTDRARRILDENGAVDLNERSSYYQSTGYTRFDASAMPYSPEQVAQERERIGTFDATALAATGAGNAAMSSGSVPPAATAAAVGLMGWDSYQNDFRARYDEHYANSGYSFEQYTPAFQYGYTLANDARYRDYDWERLEPEARRQWERQHADSPWESFKDAVRDAWQSVRDAVTPNRY